MEKPEVCNLLSSKSLPYGRSRRNVDWCDARKINQRWLIILFLLFALKRDIQHPRIP